MKLSDAKHYLPFVQAAAEGKVIQYESLSMGWYDLHKDCDISSVEVKRLRIKPTPKLRPWKPEEVPVGALIKASNGNRALILAVFQSNVVIPSLSDINYISVDSLKEKWEHSTDHGKTWLPCGVMEE